MKAKLVLLFTVTVCLCFGQTCAPPIPIPDSPIPEGTYTGTADYIMTMTDDRGQTSETEQGTITIMFGPNGLPLLDDGRECFAGASSSMTLGSMQITSVVQGIATNLDSVNVASQSQFLVVDWLLTGPEAETYTDLGNGQVYAQWEWFLASADPDFFATMHIIGTGFLNKQ